MPYILLLMDYWPPLGSWASLYIYSLFIVVEVVCGIIGGVLLDSMMADVVEDSELKTNRRSEGSFTLREGSLPRLFRLAVLWVLARSSLLSGLTG